MCLSPNPQPSPAARPQPPFCRQNAPDAPAADPASGGRFCRRRLPPTLPPTLAAIAAAIADRHRADALTRCRRFYDTANGTANGTANDTANGTAKRPAHRRFRGVSDTANGTDYDTDHDTDHGTPLVIIRITKS